jgi:site-specific recombinase XerD
MTTIREAVDEYRFSILEHSQATQEWTTRRLTRFVEWCELQSLEELEQVRPIEVRKYVEYLKSRPNEHNGKPLSSYTVHGHARVIRTFLYWCYAEELTDKQRKIAMPRLEKKVIETLTTEQIRAMFAACEKEYTSELVERDRAILSLLIDTGIRANELCSLTLDNVHLDTIDAYIKVHGKGNKWREVGLGKQSRTTLHKYMRRYRTASKENQHVFLTRYKAPMTPNGLNQVLYRLAGWSHVNVRVSAHVWRHTYAIQYLTCGGDLYKLSRLMGHVGIGVTENYVRSLSQREARNGVSVLDNMK